MSYPAKKTTYLMDGPRAVRSLAVWRAPKAAASPEAASGVHKFGPVPRLAAKVAAAHARAENCSVLPRGSPLSRARSFVANQGPNGCGNFLQPLFSHRSTRNYCTHCCCRLSCREHRVSQPGKGHLWFLSPVCTRECLAKWPLVVKPRSHCGQMCFFFCCVADWWWGAGSDRYWPSAPYEE
jgi:hypothetical protein